MSSGIYVLQLNKCLTPLEDVVNAFIGSVEPTTALTTVFSASNTGVTMYKIVGNSDTSIYPVVVTQGTHNSNGAIVTLVNVGGAGVFIFEYEGELYINHVYNSLGGVQLSGWYQVTTTAVT